MESDVAPLGYGKAIHVDERTIAATFPLSTEMKGWKMSLAEIDPTGYFLTINWVKEEGNEKT